MVSIHLVKVKNTCRSPTGLGGRRPHEFLACSDAYRQRLYECSWLARSEEGMISDNRVEADRTHVEDDEDPFKLGFPSGNGLLVIPRVEKSRGCIASTLLDDLVLYFPDSPGTKVMISRRTRNHNTAGPTHVVNWFIASHTDWLRSSNFFPFIPRLRALQISEQNSPSST